MRKVIPIFQRINRRTYARAVNKNFRVIRRDVDLIMYLSFVSVNLTSLIIFFK